MRKQYQTGSFGNVADFDTSSSFRSGLPNWEISSQHWGINSSNLPRFIGWENNKLMEFIKKYFYGVPEALVL